MWKNGLDVRDSSAAGALRGGVKNLTAPLVYARRAREANPAVDVSRKPGALETHSFSGCAFAKLEAMVATDFQGLSVLGGPISTNTTRTTAAGTQAEGGGVGSDRGMFVDPRMGSPYGGPGGVGVSQTGPMTFVEAVGKIIV